MYKKMESIIELQNVTKKFKNKLILETVSLSIPANQITAIVGKNGSGKSTLLKLIAGLSKPNTGEILFQNGKPIRIGYVPEVTPAVIPFTLVEYLTHMGTIHGLHKEWLWQRINTLLEIFHMKEDRNNRIVHFSKGMKQKVTIMQAMLEETDLLIMDEPLSGLDPKAQTEFEELLMTLKERNISVILTCHEAKLLEKVVDQLLVIHERQISHTSVQHEQGEIMNRIVFELSNTISISTLKDRVIIDKEEEISPGRKLIELNVNEEQTNMIVKEFLNRGASIKLLSPINKKETIFFKQFLKEGER